MIFVGEEFFDNPFSILFITLIFLGIVFGYVFSVRGKLQARLVGFAIDENNDIFIATKINNGEEFAIGGIGLGNMVDIALDNQDSALGNAISVAGTAISMYKLNKSFKIMENPLIISRMVSNANVLTGGIVNKILKVHRIEVYNQKVVIHYDFQNMKTLKNKQNKKMVIYRAYNAFDDLINILNSKR